MKYLIVRNWSSFQHYKDRHPPWIKLHRALLDDYEFSLLPDATKAHLMMIWLLASQHDGRVPADPKFLQRKLGFSEKADLEPLIASGFLSYETVLESASAEESKLLAERLQTATEHPRLEEERREEENPCANAEAFSRECLLTSFDEFWASYPKKRNKGDAEKAWQKLRPDIPLQVRILQAVEVAKRRDDWRKSDGQYIPYPASWLNAKGWEDVSVASVATLVSPAVQFRDSVDAEGRKLAAV